MSCVERGNKIVRQQLPHDRTQFLSRFTVVLADGSFLGKWSANFARTEDVSTDKRIRKIDASLGRFLDKEDLIEALHDDVTLFK